MRTHTWTHTHTWTYTHTRTHTHTHPHPSLSAPHGSPVYYWTPVRVHGESGTPNDGSAT